MNKLINTKMIYALIAVVLVIAFFLLYKRQAGQVKVSQFRQIPRLFRSDLRWQRAHFRLPDAIQWNEIGLRPYSPDQEGGSGQQTIARPLQVHALYCAPLPFLTRMAKTLSLTCLTSVGKKRPIFGSATGLTSEET